MKKNGCARADLLLSQKRTLASIGLLFLLAVSLSACGTGRDSAPLQRSGASIWLHTDVEQGSCATGASRECSLSLEQASGAVSCGEGTQQCEDGAWSACLTASQAPASALAPVGIKGASQAGLGPMSSVVGCAGNSCDPGCRVFDEAPQQLVAAGATASDCTSAPACEHELCDEGASLQADCHSCAATVCGVAGFEYCCAAEAGSWDSACVTAAARFCSEPDQPPLGTGTERCDYALMGSGALAIYGSAVRGGDVGGGTGSNQLVANWGVRPELTHSIYSQGALNIWAADVAGDALAEGSLDPNRCIDGVQGACAGNLSDVPKAAVPTREITCEGSGMSFSADTALAPGSYGDLSVAAGVTLTLEAGPYTVGSLSLGDGARLVLPASGTVYLDLCGSLSFGEDVTFGGVTSAADALRFIVYSETGFSIGSRSVVYGMLTAPNGTGRLDTGDSAQRTTLYGLMHVSTATLQTRSIIDATGVAGQACLDARLDVPETCPVSLADEPGEEVCEETLPVYVNSTHRYEASCPEGESPLWGLLTWEATAHGAASAKFSARVADNDVDLNSVEWTEVGVAASVPEDTQSCRLGSLATGCPVDLTELLQLERSQPSLLELGVLLAPDGANSVSVEDWEITFTCADDV